MYFIGQLLVLSLTRYREYGADHTGSLLCGKPEDLASALEKISGTISKIPTQDLRQVKTASAFMIIPALSGNFCSLCPGKEMGTGGEGNLNFGKSSPDI